MSNAILFDVKARDAVLRGLNAASTAAWMLTTEVMIAGDGGS